MHGTADLAAVELAALRTPIPVIVRSLCTVLGRSVTAYLSGLSESDQVTLWEKGDEEPSDEIAMRLRSAYLAAGLISEAYGEETAKAWFYGINRSLHDEAPVSVLRRALVPDDVRRLIPAAREFAAPGS
jgi:hypothetical protein